MGIDKGHNLPKYAAVRPKPPKVRTYQTETSQSTHLLNQNLPKCAPVRPQPPKARTCQTTTSQSTHLSDRNLPKYAPVRPKPPKVRTCHTKTSQSTHLSDQNLPKYAPVRPQPPKVRTCQTKTSQSTHLSDQNLPKYAPVRPQPPKVRTCQTKTSQSTHLTDQKPPKVRTFQTKTSQSTHLSDQNLPKYAAVRPKPPKVRTCQTKTFQTIVLGSLEKNEVNKIKANILMTIVQIKNCVELENSSAGDEDRIFENWQQLISAIEDLYQVESKTNRGSLKPCLVAVLEFHLKMVANTATLSKDEQDALISESIEKLNKLNHFSKRKKSALTSQNIVEMILEVVVKLYEELKNPSVLSILQTYKDQFVETAFRRLTANPCLFSVPYLDKRILECGGDPKINLDAAVAKIRKKVQSDQEVCNFLTRQLNHTGVNTNFSNLPTNNIRVQTKLSTKNVGLQIKSFTNDVRTQTDVLLPDATISSIVSSLTSPNRSLNHSDCSDVSSNLHSHPNVSSREPFSKQNHPFSKRLRKRHIISPRESVSSPDSHTPSKRPCTSSKEPDLNRRSPFSNSLRDPASNRQSPGSKTKLQKKSLFQLSDSDNSTDVSESVFSKSIKPLDLRSSLVGFKKSKAKPPSHTKGLAGRWTGKEEDELIRHTLKIGEVSFFKTNAYSFYFVHFFFITMKSLQMTFYFQHSFNTFIHAMTFSLQFE
ncbi:hypothetical protein Btru_047961 [Bulinus truncatus]|nr:hypothetical protein Btru_047961 [Bulinus truncatus]